MSNDPITLETLHALRMNKGTSALIDLYEAKSNKAKVEAVEAGVDFAYNNVCKNAKFYCRSSEDEITIAVVGILIGAGFDVAHERSISGHADISIFSSDDFLWIAEAKIHTSYSWLEKGYRQLLERYTTGLDGQDHGEIVIYCQKKDAAGKIVEWSRRATELPSIEITENKGQSKLFFRTKSIHPRTGLPFFVRHKILPLHFDPT